MKYYIAIDKDDIIWGVGTTKTEARKDATGTKEKLKVLQCTKELFNEVKDFGYCHEDIYGSNDSSLAYWSYSRKRQIAYLPKETKRKNVFFTI